MVSDFDVKCYNYLVKMKTYLLKIYGRVQGVGFRPFIYRLAKELNLKGYVLNSSSCVEIALQGEKTSLDYFIERMKNEAPPLSKIEKIENNILDLEDFKDFVILESRKDKGFNFISPDIAICDECLKELFDKKDRRYKYPFINCTNCGPRYTIIEDLPYDREKTTMKVFKMCEECEKEYKDPNSRRFHAQPNACFKCGPEIWIEDLSEKRIYKENVFKELAKFLKDSKIAAIKGVGGFHIACDATNECAIEQLRERKERPTKPFALMMKDIDMAKSFCFVDSKEEEILKSKERPIVLLKIKNLYPISELVTPNNKYLGVMLPYAPYHYLIFEEFDKPLIMTSGNLSDEPIIKDNEEAEEKLNGITKYFVLHNREIKHRIDDSVVFIENKNLNFIRRARGFAPDPIKIPISLKPTLALGGELKNTFSLGFENYVFMSPHIGDLKDKETLDVYEETIEEFIKLFKINPEILVCDLHPQYLSTQFGEKFKKYLDVKYMQHHKAHSYSLILDKEIDGDIIIFSFDGTGYGEDKNIWGGEVFIGDINDLKRVAHFKYFPMTKSDYVIEKPIRLLYLYVKTFLKEYENNLSFDMNPFEKEILNKSLEKNENIIYTSSCGRIFDIVSALLDIKKEVTYEGEAAVSLEMLAYDSNKIDSFYNYEIHKNEFYEIDLKETIKNIILEKDIINKEDIARKFHNTIAKICFDLSYILKEKYKIKNVGFTGGVFQNRLLIQTIRDIFKNEDFILYFHNRVPPNDGGISLGQIVLGKEE
ncbi:MAG TPA: carbamoyltransferase HypF [Caldisericia bacterium]|nr:carbamoyltransferase HypF [Caldisericia bacterium]